MASLSLCPPLADRLLGLGVACLLCACNGEDIAAPTTGVIAVIVSTTGVELDPDGYSLSLDNLGATAIEINSTRDLVVDDGSHALELDGLAVNCALQGAEGARRTVEVTSADTTFVLFDVLCSATTGAITIVTTTTGDTPDPDGYGVALDQGTPQPIGSNDLLMLGGLPAGDHTVILTGIAHNCIAGGDNPRTVTVTPGAAVETTFIVVCMGQVHRWVRVDAGRTADLTDVWGTSGSDLFVVGEIETGHPFQIASVILHYDGVQWTEQLRETDLRLRGVWGSSPTDVYAVGFDFFAPVGRLFHYDGRGWTEVPGFVSDAESLSLESVWGTSPQNVFTVGGAFDGEFELSLIYHFDGAYWQRMLVPGTVSPTLADVWGAAPNNVYAVGRDEMADPGTGVVLHFDGATWAPVLEHEGLVPDGVWGSSARDVFVVGFQVDQDVGGDFTVTSAVWHYDGNAWSPMQLPPDAAVLNEVWGSSSSDVYAVGEGGQVLHYDGSAWTLSTQTDDTLLGIWGFGPGDVYAVGNGGRILHGMP